MLPGSEAVEGFKTLNSTGIQIHGAEVQAWSWLLTGLRADRFGEVSLLPLVGGTHGDPYPLPSAPEVITDSGFPVYSGVELC